MLTLLKTQSSFTGYTGRSCCTSLAVNHMLKIVFFIKKFEDAYLVHDSVFQEPRYTCPEHSLFYKIISGRRLNSLLFLLFTFDSFAYFHFIALSYKEKT